MPERPGRHGWADLRVLARELARQQAEARRVAALEAARRAAAERQLTPDDAQLFARSVGPVHPLPPHGRVEHLPPSPPPKPLQREADERAALEASWSDEVTPESLLLTDDGLSFRRPGLGIEVVERLRRGHWALQAELDLHGHTRDEAREALHAFLRRARLQGWRCLRIVHGKGHGSPGRQAVLKHKVQRWLAQSDTVAAFAQATATHGGAGALIVLLMPQGGTPHSASRRET